MKKILIGVFAHPDDEAIAACGTLLLEKEAGTEIHLISLTAGENGMNPDNVANLGELRLKEWHDAGSLLGAAQMHHLGYMDGTLCNLHMVEISDKIIEIVQHIITDQSEIEIEFMSLDLNGFSGHIDHIVAARSVCHAFYILKEQHMPVRRVRLAALPEAQWPHINNDWIYREAGRKPNEIDEIIDATAMHDKIVEVIKCHYSQRSDGEGFIHERGERLGMNYFIEKK
jgi:LmbE family N-acetylglucosaminyl deacetylase